MKTLHLVTLHGALLASDEWDLLGEALSPWVNIQRTDLTLPGHTGNPSDLSPQSTSDVSAALLPVIEKLQEAPVVLCGHSWGGMIALDLASRHPELVHGLVLIETSWGTSTTLGERLGTVVAQILLRLVSPARLARWSGAEYGRYSARTRAYVETTVSRRSKPQIQSVMRAVFAFDIRQKLEAIRQPTLILVGARNQRTHAQAGKLQQALPRATLLTIADSGHLPMLDKPEETAAVLKQFFETHFSN